jgi:hypothetical protein
MKSPARLFLLAATALAVGLGAAALVAQPGCSSGCDTICGAPYVYIGSPDGRVQIPLTGIFLQGSSCPPAYGITCIGPPDIGGCTHFTVTGQSEGSCDVAMTFSDRDPEILHLTFGPTQHCCPGYPPIGDSSYYVPADPTQTIYGADGGSSANVMVVPDAGADGAADGGAGDGSAPDGDGTGDGGADDASGADATAD